MANSNLTSAGFATMGKLSKENFNSAQEFADEIARKLNIPSPVGESGPPGEGSRIEEDVESVAIPSGARSVTCPFAAEGAILNLINSVDASPTMAISCVNGTTVKFTQDAPTANYTLRIRRFTLVS